MDHGQPSRTAMVAAYLRDAHRELDSQPWLVDDSIARSFVPQTFAAALEAEIACFPRELFAALRVFAATRARLPEDVAIEGLANGRRDYVILGAGLDTFAWRHASAADFTIWEIDHPATQSWKRARLYEVGLTEPDNVRFISTDLANARLDALDLPLNATWNWMGVTHYLGRAATRATLESIATAGDATLVLDFALDLAHCDELGHAARSWGLRKGGSFDEQQIGLYSPDEAAAMVRGAGFSNVDSYGVDELRSRYLVGRPDLHLPGSFRMIVASP